MDEQQARSVRAAEAVRHVGQVARFAGWVFQIRRMGGISFLLLRDRTGRPLEWNLIVWDVTARKTAEQAVLEQNDQLLLAIEGSEGMIWSVDVDPTDPQGWSDTIQLDPRMKQFLGFAPNEFPNSRRAWDARIPEAYRAEVQQAMTAHAMGDAERYAVEYPIEHRDGHHVWASVRGRVAC